MCVSRQIVNTTMEELHVSLAAFRSPLHLNPLSTPAPAALLFPVPVILFSSSSVLVDIGLCMQEQRRTMDLRTLGGGGRGDFHSTVLRAGCVPF